MSPAGRVWKQGTLMIIEELLYSWRRLYSGFYILRGARQGTVTEAQVIQE
jgi:hypothetical protein